jgi:hypothetical protein
MSGGSSHFGYNYDAFASIRKALHGDQGADKMRSTTFNIRQRKRLHPHTAQRPKLTIDGFLAMPSLEESSKEEPVHNTEDFQEESPLK